jgi:hypothetical protein
MLTNPMHYVVIRIALYALSLLPMGLVAGLAGWGVTIDGGTITIQIETLIAGVFGALALSGGIFAKWGTR